MGLRGRAPKPTVIRVREGVRGHRPLAENEPVYETGVPDMPEGMSQEAQQIWADLVAEMLNANVLRKVDGLPLRMLCEDEAMAERLRKAIRAESKRVEVEAKQKYQDALAAWNKPPAARSKGKKKCKVRRDKGPKPTLRQFLPVDGFTTLMAGTEGRRLLSALSEVSSRLIMERREYGLTASSNTRVQAAAGAGGSPGSAPMREIDSLIHAGLQKTL